MTTMDIFDKFSAILVVSTLAGAGFALGSLAVYKLLGKYPVNVTANVYTYRHGGSETRADESGEIANG